MGRYGKITHLIGSSYANPSVTR